jgi:hypothetical protein
MKQISKLRIIALLLIVSIFAGCKKEEGEGGEASITGKVWVKHYDPYTNTYRGEYNGQFWDVYIIYGDDPSYGDKIETSPDGRFEFKYLQPGKYTIYTYSKDLTMPFNSTLPDVLIKKEVEIGGKKEEVDAGTFNVGYYKL